MTGIAERAYEALPVFAQNAACTLAGYRRARERFNPQFHRILHDWEQSTARPLEVLHALQRERLDRLVKRAREQVPYYRGFPPPSEVRDPYQALQRTLAEIPPLEKSTYAERPGDFLARDIPPRRLRRGKTSGTTGTALPLWYTLNTVAEEYATIWRQRRSLGVQLWDANLTFNGQIIVPLRRTRPPFWRTNHYGRQTIFSLYHMSPENLRVYAEGVHRIRARYATGYPSSLHLVARALLEGGNPLPAGRLMGVFPSSESLLAFQRETIEAGFGAPVFDRYGTAEFAVSMTECRERRLHVDMEFCIVEVEPEEETSDYMRGSLLVTALGNDATPFLRYRIGDVGTRSKHPCPCGRPGDVFLSVDGRIEDYVETPDRRLVGRLDHIFKEQRDVAEAQILQERKDSIEVRVVPRASYDADSERQLLRAIRARLGDQLEIELRHVDVIPREPNGKFRAVKSSVRQVA